MANEKKATVRDIAAKAGVSVATVSYVLNDKKDTKISDVTRKKVLQVANLLNYSIPEKYKNIDARKGAYTIGVMYTLRPDTPSRNMEIMSLINLLAGRFFRIGFNCQLIPLESSSEYQKPVEGLDGIIAIDLEESVFKQMSGQYFIPILCLDMMINDFLFYQIYTDMESISRAASEILGDGFYLVTDKYSNSKYNDYLISSLPKGKSLFFSDLEEKGFSVLDGKKVLVYGTQLGMIIKQNAKCKDMLVITSEDAGNYYSPAIKNIHHDIEKKANLAMNIMMNAIEKKFDVKHEYKVF
ncbi:LacI family DNA-binding transcriptional regulator [Butyrivibrio sp. VCB2006]|uniref:LacI family DNA-binding transcriptional regulator n=1 Tax=Butyrivibrio sp. VCB2006 TaxID=1280679 RepID=UPI000409AE11|nr:LacI family DNA-binding transcriptional regulator [Butyrivibrio sp. VCB2006]